MNRARLPVLLALAALVGQASAGEEESPRPGLVVVVPADWIPALDPYVTLRKKTLEVEVAALEDVLAKEEGGDAPERIKRFLYRGWKERNVRYALLVGDADTLPVRFMVLDRVTEPAFDTAFYACDLYYADVARTDGGFDDWNGAHEGFHARYFGEVNGEKHKDPPINLDGISYVPEVGVGRWPVSTVADLKAIIAKTVAWEERATAAPEKRSRRALFLHTDGWVDARGGVGAWADAMAASGWAVERRFYGSEGGAGDPSPATILPVVERGAEVLFHAGHGCEAGWPGCLGPGEETALGKSVSAIYVSAGCGTGVFVTQAPYQGYLDEAGIVHRGTNAGEVFTSPPPPPAPLQPGRFNETSFGERLVRMPEGGAVAYVGCNTGSQPCGLTLLEGLAGALARPATALGAGPATEPRRLGDAWNAALAHYYEKERLSSLLPTADWYPPSIFFQGMKFMLFGDPALPLP